MLSTKPLENSIVVTVRTEWTSVHPKKKKVLWPRFLIYIYFAPVFPLPSSFLVSLDEKMCAKKRRLEKCSLRSLSMGMCVYVVVSACASVYCINALVRIRRDSYKKNTDDPVAYQHYYIYLMCIKYLVFSSDDGVHGSLVFVYFTGSFPLFFQVRIKVEFIFMCVHFSSFCCCCPHCFLFSSCFS